MKALIKISSLLVILCVSFLGKAQIDYQITGSKTPAYTQINQLKHGVLIVYLKTNHKKINVLQKMAKDRPNNKRYKKLLNRIIKERNTLQQATIRAYNTEYSFSKVLFMPDTCAKKLFEGTRSGIFVNNQLEVDDTLRIKKDQPFFISFIGTPSTSTTTGKKSLLIGDHKGEALQSPFPYAIRMYGLGDIIVSKSEGMVIENVVRKQQQKLGKFYQKLQIKLAMGKLTDNMPKTNDKPKKRKKYNKHNKNRKHSDF